MQGLMQYHPLMISSVIEFAATYHGDTEVVSRRVEGDIHRSNYATINRRAKQIANALDAMGLAQSARVGTLAWNGYRHFELYYGVSGSGRVLHTLNPRLHPEQLAWIINHAEDEALCFDMTFLPLVKAVAAKLPTVKHFIALCDADKLPADSGIPNLQSYETWIGAHSDQYVWPAFDENLASSLCYTSGTTGNPKGVLYSHRSTMLHAMAGAATDVIGICSRDTVLPVVPMFHVNAWGLPYLMPMVGAKVVFPGGALDGKSIYELFEGEKVTFSAGVPTVTPTHLARIPRSRALSASACRRRPHGRRPLVQLRRHQPRGAVAARRAVPPRAVAGVRAGHLPGGLLRGAGA